MTTPFTPFTEFTLLRSSKIIYLYMKCDCFMKKIDQSDLEETLFLLRNYVKQGL